MNTPPLSPYDLLKEHFGTQAAIAKAAGFDRYQVVQQWDPERIPAEHVRRLCEASGWKITPHQLRADLYPNPGDALPVDA